MTGTRYIPWERLYVPPAPAPAPCHGADPRWFDIEYYAGVNVIRRDQSAPTASHADRIGAALRYCATCPLAVRDWCVESVRPAESGYSGVAGGVVWSNGRRVWDVRRQLGIEDGAA